jgi:predicted homoserine dehydrogenase-like protein
MDVVAISNRTIQRARDAFALAGVESVVEVSTAAQLERAIAGGRHAVTEDAELVCSAEGVDAVLEVTGTVEFGARVVLAAIENGKHIVTMNAELNGTLGPTLKLRADSAGVVFTDSEGDQPGVIMNLFRFVRGIGVEPVLIGNLKGLHDPYRNPTTQERFARDHGLAAHMATSFADGTKMSFEMAIVANATGYHVAKLGMHGPPCDHVENAADLFPAEVLERGRVVDYVVGAEPAPGVFILGRHDNRTQRDYLKLYKLGDGPYYTFYTPYHLCHFEVPTTIARAVLFGDAAIAPIGRPMVEVVSAAKRDLQAGEVVDGIGWYMTYGLCQNVDEADGLLPMGIAEGARLVRDVPKDALLTRTDVELPSGRLCDRLRAEQATQFPRGSTFVAETV